MAAPVRGPEVHQLGPESKETIPEGKNFITNANQLPYETTDHFLQTLENWNTAIPFKFHWIVRFYSPTFPGPHGMIDPNAASNRPETVSLMELGSTAAHAVNRYEPVGYNDREMRNSQGNILTEFNMNSPLGCIFAQGCVIPGETHSVENPSVQNSMGFLPGVISSNRSPLAQLTVQFRETNTSFADAIIRPWIISLSHYGLVARPPGDWRNVKRDIEVLQLARVASGHPLVIRKRFLFHNCVPTTLDTSELTHDGTEMKIYTVPFHYTNYSVKYDSSDLTDDTVKSYFEKLSSKPKRTTGDVGSYDTFKDREAIAQEHIEGNHTTATGGYKDLQDIPDIFATEYTLDKSREEYGFPIVPSPQFKRPKSNTPSLGQTFLTQLGRGVMRSRTVSNLLGDFNRIFKPGIRMSRSRRDYANSFGSGRFLSGPGVSGFVSGLIDSLFGNERLFVDGFAPNNRGMSRAQIAAVHSTDDPNIFIDADNGSGWSRQNNRLAQKLQSGNRLDLVDDILNSVFGSRKLSVKRAVVAASHITDAIDVFRS